MLKDIRIIRNYLTPWILSSLSFNALCPVLTELKPWISLVWIRLVINGVVKLFGKTFSSAKHIAHSWSIKQRYNPSPGNN